MIKDYIFQMITGNTDITNLVADRVYYRILPELHNYTKPSIVYEVDTVATYNTGSHQNVYEEYHVRIKAIGKKLSAIRPISEFIKNMFIEDTDGLTKYDCVLYYQMDTEIYDINTDTFNIPNTFLGKYYKK